MGRVMVKTDRIYMVWPEWLKTEARLRAQDKGIKLSEYVKDLVKNDIKSCANLKNKFN